MTRLLLTLALALLPAALAAQDEPEGFSLGLGVAGGNSPYVGEDEQATALPILRYSSERFSIGFPDGARLTLFSQGGLRFSAVLAPRLSAIDLSDAPELDGITREITADGGVQADLGFGRGTRLTLHAVTELTDEHEGQEVTLGLVQPIPLGGVPIILGAGASWQSEELAEYVWGVRDSDTSAYGAYSPGEVVIPYVSLGTMIPLSDRVSLVGNIRADFLPDEVTASPIIDEDVSVGAVLGITYRF